MQQHARQTQPAHPIRPGRIRVRAVLVAGARIIGPLPRRGRSLVLAFEPVPPPIQRPGVLFEIQPPPVRAPVAHAEHVARGAVGEGAVGPRRVEDGVDGGGAGELVPVVQVEREGELGHFQAVQERHGVGEHFGPHVQPLVPLRVVHDAQQLPGLADDRRHHEGAPRRVVPFREAGYFVPEQIRVVEVYDGGDRDDVCLVADAPGVFIFRRRFRGGFRAEGFRDGVASYGTPDAAVWIGGLHAVREVGVSAVVRRDVEFRGPFKLELARLFPSPRVGILQEIVPIARVADVEFELPDEGEVGVHDGE